MWLELKNVHRVKKRLADGTQKLYLYAWRGGPRLCDEYGNPLNQNASPAEITASVEREKQDRKSPIVGTISWLIDDFKKSDKWQEFKPRTQADHLKHFQKIQQEFGSNTLKKAEARGSRAAFKNWRQSMARTPKVADNHWSSLSRIFTYAVDQEYMSRNPCLGAGKLYSGNRADKWWTPDDLTRFRAVASPELKLGLLLAVHTGQRQGDLLALKWNQYDGERLIITQSKTGKTVSVKCTDSLRRWLDQIPRTSTHVLVNSRGIPWTPSGFQASFRKATRKVGIKDRTFHDLRGTFVVNALRNGGGIEAVAKITGHSLNDLRTLEKHYMGWDQEAADSVILALNQNGK